MGLTLVIIILLGWSLWEIRMYVMGLVLLVDTGVCDGNSANGGYGGGFHDSDGW